MAVLYYFDIDLFYQLIMILKDEKQHLFYIIYFTRICQGIDSCFYAFSKTRNTPKFDHFHIGLQPTQISQQSGIKI